jgi:hypothetical protein
MPVVVQASELHLLFRGLVSGRWVGDATVCVLCLRKPQAARVSWLSRGTITMNTEVCCHAAAAAAPAGFGAGDSPSDPCTLCPPGTFSEGKSLEKCMPCGFGMTSPAGSKAEDDCRPVNQCPAGTGGVMHTMCWHSITSFVVITRLRCAC